MINKMKILFFKSFFNIKILNFLKWGDFKGMEDYADFIIMNNGEFTPEQIAQVIVEGYYGLEK